MIWIRIIDSDYFLIYDYAVVNVNRATFTSLESHDGLALSSTGATLRLRSENEFVHAVSENDSS